MEPPVVFRVDPTPTIGTPVFALGYRAQSYRRRWWQGWRDRLARLGTRLACWILRQWGDPVIPRIS